MIIQRGSAQERLVDSLINLQLPPIETLFENARKNSMIEFYNYRMEEQELNLKTERRSWLGYFSLSATYQYGVMGVNTFTDVGSNFPIIYQNSGGDQLYYNAGATFRLPLDNFFDRRNRIKTQQLKIKETLKERDLWYDQQKIQIIEIYFKVQEMLKNMEYVVDLLSFANANYEAVQKDYIVGAASMQALNTAKSTQIQSLLQLETLKSDLLVNLNKLEILSYTKIINK